MNKQEYISDVTVQRPFACNYCTYRAKRNHLLQDHVKRRHMENYSYPCSVPNCDYKGKTKSDLRIHQKNRHTPVAPVTCTFEGCNFKTKFNKELKCHVLNRHTSNRKKDIDCPLCPEKFFTRFMMKQHLMVHTQEKPWKCSQCDYESKSNGHLRRHVETIHGKPETSSAETMLKCDQCDFRTAFKDRFKAHVISHSNDQPYVCKFPGCDYRSRYKHYIEVHEISNHAPERHPCPHSGCKYVATHEKHLKVHLSHVHRKPFRCKVLQCDKSCNSKTALIKHQKMHDLERQFKCEQCHLRFATKNSLATHIRNRHTEEKNLECPHSCGYRTNQRGNLRSHLKWIHKAEDIICSVSECKFKSCSPYDMMKHSERHDFKSRPFRCGYCPCGFTYNTALTQHVKREHSGDKLKQIHRSGGSKSKPAKIVRASGCEAGWPAFLEPENFKSQLPFRKVPTVLLTKTVIEFL